MSRRQDLVPSTHNSLDVLTEIYRNEEASLLIQTYPLEVVKRAVGEITVCLSAFTHYAREYRDTLAFSPSDTKKLFKNKLLMDYYALCYLSGSKNYYLYNTHRMNLIKELAVTHNGLYDVIPMNVIERLSDQEATFLRDTCNAIIKTPMPVRPKSYSIIAVLKDIVTDDIADRSNPNMRYYPKGAKLTIPTDMAELLVQSNWIKVIKTNL
ncbi:toll-like receptor 8 isoform X2, putative [Babesia ovata]|uniref:Toll-like receptor 8 isoform X2, putative n=1 Tax=Babesia ovata TaxID=189622 RepID=A0A2H6K858_9APIC|nr:toll-like receptor 8 isoform X2, putative [Babesia ovata]GBE59183.1 toll-like receptor 8 isoform X2, putative [Babesia ovata]